MAMPQLIWTNTKMFFKALQQDTLQIAIPKMKHQSRMIKELQTTRVQCNPSRKRLLKSISNGEV